MFKELFTESSWRDDIDKLIVKLLDRHSIQYKKDKKLGYTVYDLDNGLRVVNDGVGISIKKDGKEIFYGDTLKMDYKKILDYYSKN
jgi:hypothetical protein